MSDDARTSDATWKVKPRPVKDADRRRDVYLDQTQRRALIAKAPAGHRRLLRRTVQGHLLREHAAKALASLTL